MPGKLIETYQVRVYMNDRELGLSQAEASYVAEFSERSGQRIEAGDYQPNRGKVREWRTSADPLAEVWESELEPMLRATPKHMAVWDHKDWAFFKPKEPDLTVI